MFGRGRLEEAHKRKAQVSALEAYLLSAFNGPIGQKNANQVL